MAEQLAQVLIEPPPRNGNVLVPPPPRQQYTPTPNRPEDIWGWWDRSHPNQEPPSDFPSLITQWAREDPQSFQQFNAWHEQDVGYPFASPVGGGEDRGYQTRWEPTPSYRLPEGTGGPLFSPTYDTRVNIPNVSRAALGPFADEFAGGIAAISGGPEAYASASQESQRAGEAFRVANPTAATAAEIGGMFVPGMAAGRWVMKGGNLVWEAAKGVGAAAGAGALYGGAAAQGGFPGEPGDFNDRLRAAGVGAVETAPFGLVGPLAGQALRPLSYLEGPSPRPFRIGPEAADEAAERYSRQTSPGVDRFLAPPALRTENQIQQLRDSYQQQGNRFFQAADASGIRISPTSLQWQLDNWRSTLRDQFSFDPVSHQYVARLLNRLQRKIDAGEPITWGWFDNVYKDIGENIGSAGSRERSLLFFMRDGLTDWVGNIPASHLTGIANLSGESALRNFQNAQNAFRQYGRLDAVSDAYSRALDRAGLSRATTQTNIPFGQAFREEMNRLIDSDQWAKFTPEQQQMIRNDIVRGNTGLHNLAARLRQWLPIPSEGAAEMAAAAGAISFLHPDLPAVGGLGVLPLLALRGTEALDKWGASSARGRFLNSLIGSSPLSPTGAPYMPAAYYGAGLTAGLDQFPYVPPQ